MMATRPTPHPAFKHIYIVRNATPCRVISARTSEDATRCCGRPVNMQIINRVVRCGVLVPRVSFRCDMPDMQRSSSAWWRT